MDHMAAAVSSPGQRTEGEGGQATQLSKHWGGREPSRGRKRKRRGAMRPSTAAEGVGGPRADDSRGCRSRSRRCCGATSQQRTRPEPHRTGQKRQATATGPHAPLPASRYCLWMSSAPMRSGDECRAGQRRGEEGVAEVRLRQQRRRRKPENPAWGKRPAERAARHRHRHRHRTEQSRARERTKRRQTPALPVQPLQSSTAHHRLSQLMHCTAPAAAAAAPRGSLRRHPVPRLTSPAGAPLLLSFLHPLSLSLLRCF